MVRRAARDYPSRCELHAVDESRTTLVKQERERGGGLNSTYLTAKEDLKRLETLAYALAPSTDEADRA